MFGVWPRCSDIWRLSDTRRHGGSSSEGLRAMNDVREQRIRENLQRLAAARLLAISLLEESIAILQTQLTEDSFVEGSQTTHAPDSSPLPIVDRRVMSVVFRGKHCFLGDTLMLRFLEHLIQHPNQYIAYRTLLDDVWKDQRDPSSVRSVVKELRARLEAAGMSELSAAIEGHRGHYGLMLAFSK